MSSPSSSPSDLSGKFDMARFINSGTIALTAAFAGVLFGAQGLLADGLAVPPIRDRTVAKECAACHMLYPAALLPARSWKAMTGNLADHFGDNATLDAATARTIEDYLTANAADAGGRQSKLLRRLDPAVTPARITDLPWWRRKHEKKDRVAPATLARKGAKFKGDCKACHKQAEQGRFEEEN